MTSQDQKTPNNSANQSQQQQPNGYPYPFPPTFPSNSNNNPSSNNNSNTSANNNNQQGNMSPPGYPFQPPYGYPYPFPPQAQPSSNNAESSNNNQNQGQMPPGFPYPPYPYPPYGFPFPNQGGQQQNQGNSNQPPFPYPPYGFPYPYPYPPPQQGQGNANQPSFPCPPYGYPYPYPYPPQQQQQQQQQPQHTSFDWERRGLPTSNDRNSNFNSNFNSNQNNNNQQAPPNHSLFDWEKGNAEPQKPVEIDWNYKSEYDVPDVAPEVERDPSILVTIKSKAFDPSTLPALDDSFFKLTRSEVASQIKASTQRQTFRNRNKSTSKETFTIKFEFSEESIFGLSVSATFHIKEKTCKLYEFLNEYVFKEGTTFIVKTTVPPKAIGNNNNQQLKDVKITGNTILFVKISEFKGLKDEVNEQYLLQKHAIEESLRQAAQENQEQVPQ